MSCNFTFPPFPFSQQIYIYTCYSRISSGHDGYCQAMQQLIIANDVMTLSLVMQYMTKELVIDTNPQFKYIHSLS